MKWVTPEVTLLTKYNTAQWTYYLQRRRRSTCVAPPAILCRSPTRCFRFAFVSDVEILELFIWTPAPRLPLPANQKKKKNNRLHLILISKQESDPGTVWESWVLRVAFRLCARPPEQANYSIKAIEKEKWGCFTVVSHACRWKHHQNASF